MQFSVLSSSLLLNLPIVSNFIDTSGNRWRDEEKCLDKITNDTRKNILKRSGDTLSLYFYSIDQGIFSLLIELLSPLLMVRKIMNFVIALVASIELLSRFTLYWSFRNLYENPFSKGSPSINTLKTIKWIIKNVFNRLLYIPLSLILIVLATPLDIASGIVSDIIAIPYKIIFEYGKSFWTSLPFFTNENAVEEISFVEGLSQIPVWIILHLIAIPFRYIPYRVWTTLPIISNFLQYETDSEGEIEIDDLSFVEGIKGFFRDIIFPFNTLQKILNTLQLPVIYLKKAAEAGMNLGFSYLHDVPFEQEDGFFDAIQDSLLWLLIVAPISLALLTISSTLHLAADTIEQAFIFIKTTLFESATGRWSGEEEHFALLEGLSRIPGMILYAAAYGVFVWPFDAYQNYQKNHKKREKQQEKEQRQETHMFICDLFGDLFDTRTEVGAGARQRQQQQRVVYSQEHNERYTVIQTTKPH